MLPPGSNLKRKDKQCNKRAHMPKQATKLNVYLNPISLAEKMKFFTATYELSTSLVLGAQRFKVLFGLACIWKYQQKHNTVKLKRLQYTIKTGRGNHNLQMAHLPLKHPQFEQKNVRIGSLPRCPPGHFRIRLFACLTLKVHRDLLDGLLQLYSLFFVPLSMITILIASFNAYILSAKRIGATRHCKC